MTEKELMEQGIEPLARDTSRFKKLWPDRRTTIRENPTKSFPCWSTAELIGLTSQAEP